MTVSCGQDNHAQSDYVSLSMDKMFLEFTAEGGEQTFTVTASEQIYLVPGNGWVSVQKGERNTDNRTIVTVMVEKNSAVETRTTKISVVAGDEKMYMEVLQEAGGKSDDDKNGFVGLGWNLGNHMDAHSNGISNETCWGNPKATQETFRKVREYGFTHVRIPVTWLGHIGQAPDYKIDEAWLDRVYEIVGYAENAGLVAVLNIHHDGADSAHWLDIKTAAKNPSVHQQIKDQLKAMWTQIAVKFKDKGEFLVFESMNEIHDGGWGWGENRSDGGKQYQCYNEWQQVFVDAVRAAGGENATRYLGIPGYCTNPDLTIAHLVLPKDVVPSRLMVAVHCYDPYEYCLQAKYSEWGHTGAAGKKTNWGDEDNIVKVFSNLFDKFVSQGIPVYMGEMGCVNRATQREQAFQQYYLEYYAKVARTYGIVPYIWDNGAAGSGEERHAFINHATGEYCSNAAKAAIEAFLKGMFTESEEYTIDAVYDNAPR